MNVLNAIFWIFCILVALYGIWLLYFYILRRRSATMVDSDQINEHIRRVQVIDVREPAEFRASHILGARNIPMSEFNLRYKELRKDTAIYLYDDNLVYASRCANILRKKGYKDINILEGGFENWSGKVKSDID